VTAIVPSDRARAPGLDAAVRVLVVDDEPGIRAAVATALRYEGFAAEQAATGRRALELAVAWRPALVVLDVMLPDHDGMEVARRLRRDRILAPVVFLTARDATPDVVAGLALGDDYVTKPFSLEELVARVRAVLRRTAVTGATAPAGERLVYEDLELDQATHEVWRAGRRVELTATEFKLLRQFLLHPRRVLSKTLLLEQVWGYESAGGNVVETYVSYLRRKVDRLGPPLLHTVRGAGYVLRRAGG